MSVPGTTTLSVTRAWLTLIGLTLATFVIGMLGYRGMGLTLVVLLIALLKGQLIVDYFMLPGRTAPIWRMLLTSYLATIGLMLLVAFGLAAW